jgi:DNA-binding CsgD family transcriptional regulator
MASRSRRSLVDLCRRLVAGGLTNGAAARRLYISPHTVNTHLRHVFAKLGVPNRVALAAVVHHSIK